MQRDAADQLHVEVPQADRAPGGLADRGERLGQQVVEGLALGQALAERGGEAWEAVVGHRPHALVERVGGSDELAVLAEQALVAAAEDRGQELEHGSGSFGG